MLLNMFPGNLWCSLSLNFQLLFVSVEVDIMIGEGLPLVTLVHLDILGLHLVMGDLGHEVVIIPLLKRGITQGTRFVSSSWL